MVRVIRQKRFLVGFFFLFCLFALSFSYSTIKTHYPFSKETILYDSNGKVLDEAPFPPSFHHPLGTDKEGHSLFLQIIEGAKFTIGLAIIITAMQYILSVFLGFILSFLHRKFYYPIFHFLNGSYYVPLTLWAYIILAPVVITFLWSFSPEEQVTIPIIVLTLIGVPSVSVQVTEEIRSLYKREFIVVAKTLGGGRWHIFKTHVVPFMRSKLVLLFTQQLVQILVLIVALAILDVYIGGVDQEVIFGKPMGQVHGDYEKVANQETTKNVILSLHNEWGGLIARNKTEVQTAPWLVYIPALAFCLTVVSIQMIGSAFRRVFNQEDQFKRRRRKNKERSKSIPLPEEEDFHFISAY